MSSGEEYTAAKLPFEVFSEDQGIVFQSLARAVDEEKRRSLYNALEEY